MFTLRKVGGLYHWRMWRIGGSFYVAKPKPRATPSIDWQAVINHRLSL